MASKRIVRSANSLYRNFPKICQLGHLSRPPPLQIHREPFHNAFKIAKISFLGSLHFLQNLSVSSPEKNPSIFLKNYPQFSFSLGTSFLDKINNNVALLGFTRNYATKVKKGKQKNKEQQGGRREEEGVVGRGEGTGGIAPGGSLEDIQKSTKDLMGAAMDSLTNELSKLRTGRASPGMLDHVMVDAYGTSLPLNRVATVSVRDPQLLSVSLHDPNLLSAVQQGILQSPMGLNPISEGSSLSVPVPRLTQEVRQAMAKLVVKAGETAKVSLRRARKEGLDEAKKIGDSISEDLTKKNEKVIQDLTNKFTKQVEDLCKTKEKEIMSG